LCVYTEYSVS